MCCHPLIMRIDQIIVDHPSRTKARIPHIKLMRTSSNHFSGMKNTSPSSKDRSKSNNSNKVRNSSTAFSKKSHSSLKTYQFLQNHSPKRKQPTLRSYPLIHNMPGNLSNSSNKKLKMSVGSKKNFWRLSELKSMRTNLKKLKAPRKSLEFFKGNLLENTFQDSMPLLETKKILSQD